MVNVDNRGNPRDPRGSNNSLYFIVGALVIAVLIIGWFMYGGDAVDDGTVNTTTETPAVTPSTDTNVTVETPATPPATPEPAPTTPEPAPATPPAADPAPATPPSAEPAPTTPPAGTTTP